jgi:uncharacterized membrane protein (UPF0127 family)
MENLLLASRCARFLLLAAALLLTPCAWADATRARTIPLKVGAHALRVEVMSNDADRACGMMHRKHLGANDGMLFIFEEPAYHSMWMKNTLIPLSVAFLDRNGVILNILDMEPETLDPHVSAGPSIYAIETNKGWFAAKKIKPGDKVTGLPGKN